MVVFGADQPTHGAAPTSPTALRRPARPICEDESGRLVANLKIQAVRGGYSEGMGA